MSTSKTANTKPKVKPTLAMLLSKANNRATTETAAGEGIPEAAEPVRHLFQLDATDEEQREAREKGDLLDLLLDHVSPDPTQPRRTFDKQALADLQATIEQNGVIQPITVREKIDKPGHFIIITGERRWRASTAAGLATIPAYIRRERLNPEELLAAQIIENAESTRADVPIWEEAKSVQRFIVEFNWAQVQIAKKLGMPAPWVNKRIKLLEMPSFIHPLLDSNIIRDIETAHALRKLNDYSPNTAARLAAEGLKNGQLQRAEVTKAARDEKRRRDFNSRPKMSAEELQVAIKETVPKLATAFQKASGGQSNNVTVVECTDKPGSLVVTVELADYLGLRSLMDSLKA